MTSTCNHPHLSLGTDQASNPLSFQYSTGGDAKLIWLSNVLDKMNPLYDSLHQSLDKMDDGWLDAELPAAKRSVQSCYKWVEKRCMNSTILAAVLCNYRTATLRAAYDSPGVTNHCRQR